MIQWRFLLFICLSVLQLNSCSIEEARHQKNRKLVVLSDYLEPQDSIIFKSFKRQQDIDIEIIHLSTDKMIGLTRNKKYTADADIIMVKSMYDVHRLSQQSILQQIVFKNELSDKQRKYVSTKYNYFGFGIDPFVNVHQTSKRTSMNSDLVNKDFINLLDDKQRTVFFSPILKKMSRVNSKQWIKRVINHSINDLSILDSNKHISVLTTYSDYKQNNFYRKKAFSGLTFPNSTKNGTFYNLRTMAIVEQTENYSMAKLFIKFYLQTKQNQELTKQLSVLPLQKKTDSFREYSVRQDELIQFFTLTNRILNILNNDK